MQDEICIPLMMYGYQVHFSLAWTLSWCGSHTLGDPCLRQRDLHGQWNMQLLAMDSIISSTIYTRYEAQFKFTKHWTPSAGIFYLNGTSKIFGNLRPWTLCVVCWFNNNRGLLVFAVLESQCHKLALLYGFQIVWNRVWLGMCWQGQVASLWLLLDSSFWYGQFYHSMHSKAMSFSHWQSFALQGSKDPLDIKSAIASLDPIQENLDMVHEHMDNEDFLLNLTLVDDDS